MTSADAECSDPSSNHMQGTISFSLLLFAINKALLLIYPRNIISNIIMIFNINSTRGQTRFLTCVARVTCLVLIIHCLAVNVLQNECVVVNRHLIVISSHNMYVTISRLSPVFWDAIYFRALHPSKTIIKVVRSGQS